MLTVRCYLWPRRYFRMTHTANAGIKERTMDPELMIDEPAIHNLIGACYLGMGDSERAAEQLEEGLALFPHELDMRYNLAIVRIRQEEWAQASEQLTAALAAATSASQAAKLLEQADHLRGMGQLAAAQAFEQKTVDLQA